MKFCSKCGKEIMDEEIICTDCGCPVQTDDGTKLKKELNEIEIQKRIEKNKRTVIITVSLICVMLALFLVFILIVNSFKSDKIIKELSGEDFRYNGDTSYMIAREYYTFDDEGNCEYSYYYYYYYGFLDEELSFTNNYTYKIKFKKNSAYLVLSNGDELKIKYDEDGEIISLYDSEERKTYER